MINMIELLEEAPRVAAMMEKYGGCFVKCLGAALVHADITNAEKIKKTWPEYWKEYLDMWEQRQKESPDEKPNRIDAE